VHIGLCSPHWPPSEGANGIVSYVAAVREHFSAKGHLVSVISQGRLFSSDGDVVAIPPMAQSWRGKLKERVGRRIGPRGALGEVGNRIAQEVAGANRIRPFDVLEMEESFGWSEIVRRRTGLPVVTRLHGPWFLKPVRERTAEQERADRSRCLAEATAVRSAPLITAPTRAIMEATCTRCGRDPNKSSAVIANPIKITADRPQWRLDACERDHILMIGRFDEVKGADTLLMAFQRLLELRPSARLTLVGPDRGIEIRPGHAIGFEAYARASLSPETREHITFKGLLSPEEVAKLRTKAHVTVVSSRWENFPYVLLEGFAAGSPMISTDWPGSDEILVHGETGLLTPVGQPNTMAEHLDWLLSQPDAAARIGAAGKKRCSEVFSVEVVGDQILQQYEAVLQSRAR